MSTPSLTQPRLLLPIALAVVVIRGASMPWITVRTFSGNERTYNLIALRGGVAIILTISLFMVVGGVVGIFKRITGMTIMSMSAATLGWLAAISGMLLTLLWSLIPSINVAGIDLAKATLSQGSGVVVTVVASLALAFMVVRQLEPFATYAPTTRIPILPLVVVVFLTAISVCMHSRWLRLGTDGSGLQVNIAGDTLYGSGLVVLGLWLAVGLWIGALMVNRSLVIAVASSLTVVVSLIVGVYAVFMWAGGRLLDWLVPARLDEWTAVSIEPPLYVVAVSVVVVFGASVLGFFPRTHRWQISLGARTPGLGRVFYSDIAGTVLLLLVLTSAVV